MKFSPVRIDENPVMKIADAGRHHVACSSTSMLYGV